MTTQEKISIMQAYVDGRQIQIRESEEWIDFYIAGEPSWNWQDYEYRVKPEPKQPTYRPYKDFAEFLSEWEKHGGLVIDKSTCKCRLVNTFDLESANALLADYTWADDNTPCGIKEE